MPPPSDLATDPDDALRAPLGDDAPQDVATSGPRGGRPEETPPGDAPALETALDDESALEEAAREKLGLRRWDRPALFRETAEAATDTDLPFWSVLLLSGAIATLGLVLNSTAVVIGAMLVAPLLGPLLGLSLALAVGDGRLFIQTFAAILLGAAGIVALAALLTAALPFQTVTDEIAARTRPTTLDLGIAVFSGLAGAVVTASREKRLSASIPGVAVAVALVPPLGVAGFGVGIGWQWPIIRGALLLFGANLAGIVFSGLLVFLLVGMHRDDVVKAARSWHEAERASGLSARLGRLRVLDRVHVLSSPWARVGLVLAFAVAVAFPLSTSLAQVVREARVSSAVDAVAAALETDDRAFVIDREINYGDDASSVRLRVATTEWITDEEEAAFTERATAAAGEAVALDLEQVLASAGDLASFADLLPSRPAVRTAPPTAEATPLPATLATVRGRLADALDGLALPDSTRVLGAEVRVGTAGAGPTLRITYGAPRALSSDALTVLRRQAAQSVGLAPEAVRLASVRLGARALPDSAQATRLLGVLRQAPRLRLTVTGDSAALEDARRWFADAPGVRFRPGPARARLTVAPDSTDG